ncbi:hypothetical protein [Amycolatopsis sp. PS_44_ISF1]|uniref:hypothetical protein n=1 Tax=Amycolatopsis sp. PS_44_ISF1 TaxID=2974917 RepID=UPI0028DDB7B6|nr:hypothetical protein [Amycolatopsis sp. PS_44_ISF1]MDT8913904.1 hypothetical protein [Amycolatopsis sp. PS_44_ISF1]
MASLLSRAGRTLIVSGGRRGVGEHHATAPVVRTRPGRENTGNPVLDDELRGRGAKGFSKHRIDGAEPQLGRRGDRSR